jgi:hypothetical protein
MIQRSRRARVAYGGVEGRNCEIEGREGGEVRGVGCSEL